VLLIALGAFERNCGRMQRLGSNVGPVNPRLALLPYPALGFHRFQLCAVAVICIRMQTLQSNACISAIERMACVRTQPCDPAAHQFSINRPLSAF
jgi:hypothetical protein